MTANMLYGTSALFDDRKLTGPILDVDYEMESSSDQIPSLQDFSAKKAVSDSYITRKCINFMPSRIKVIVMNKALEEGRLPTVSFLLKKWPYNKFQFPELPILKKWHWSCSYQNNRSLFQKLKKTLDSAAAVLNVFLETIRRGFLHSKLKFLDLSAVPLTENDVVKVCNYIADTCVPAMYSENARRAEKCENDAKKVCYSNADTCVPLSGGRQSENARRAEKHFIKFHCTLNSRDATRLLYEALMAQEMGLSPIQLSVGGLRFTHASLSCKRAKDLFEFLNPDDLEVLSFDFTSIKDDVMDQILSHLHKFCNLRALEFAYCHFEVSQNDFCMLLREQFKEMPHISRLNFTNCDLGSCVASLFEFLHSDQSELTGTKNSVSADEFNVPYLYPSCQRYVPENLKYLNLSGCRLTSSDLDYLARSPHIQSLKNLNLSNNVLGRHFKSLLKLLRELAPSLCVLEISDGYFRDEQLVELVSVLLEMESLQFLNIANSSVCDEALLPCIHKLCMIPHLKTLCLSIPWTVHLMDKSNFRENATKIIMSERKSINVLWQS